MKALSRVSIRTRITIGTFLLAAAFSAVAAFVVHSMIERILLDSTDQLLRTDIAPFQTTVLRDPQEIANLPSAGQSIAVLDPTGQVQLATLPRGLRPYVPDLVSAGLDSGEYASGTTSYRVATDQVDTDSGVWTIVALRDQSANDIVTDRIALGLVAGGGVLTVAFAAASWLLTGAALRPVTELRTSAEDIVRTHSDALLPVTEARDEIRDLALTLNRLIDELRESAQRERQLVSDASHELRTPLAVLQARLELLRVGDRSNLDEDIASAERAATRLSRLVSDLLELTRLDASTDTPGWATAAALVDEVGEAVDRARASSSSLARIELEVTGSVHEDARARIDARTFGRVADNLLSNALTAVAGAGEIRVTVAHDASALVLAVLDDGPGVHEDFLPHAFERFAQQDGSRQAGSGAGLGLAIVSAAVGAAGGSATLANRVPRGAVATVSIPLRIHPEPL